MVFSYSTLLSLEGIVHTNASQISKFTRFLSSRPSIFKSQSIDLDDFFKLVSSEQFLLVLLDISKHYLQIICFDRMLNRIFCQLMTL